MSLPVSDQFPVIYSDDQLEQCDIDLSDDAEFWREPTNDQLEAIEPFAAQCVAEINEVVPMIFDERCGDCNRPRACVNGTCSECLTIHADSEAA